MKKKSTRFGDLVFAHRKQRGLTLQELAALVDISPGAISRIENSSRRRLGYSIVYKLRSELCIPEPMEGFTF